LSQCNIYAVAGGPLDVSPLVACQKALVKGDYLSGGHSHIFFISCRFITIAYPAI